MKEINVKKYFDIVEDIVKEREKQAEKLGREYVGLTGDELQREVVNHLGDAWAIKKEESVKFTRADINAVAGARFFKETGRSLLMGLAIIILGLSVGMKYIPEMTALYYNIYYAVCGLIALIFIYVYSRKQAKVRKRLWRQLGREDIKEER